MSVSKLLDIVGGTETEEKYTIQYKLYFLEIKKADIISEENVKLYFFSDLMAEGFNALLCFLSMVSDDIEILNKKSIRFTIKGEPLTLKITEKKGA